MKISVLEGHSVNPGDLSWSVLEQFGDVTIYDKTRQSDAVAQISDAQIVLINKTVIDAALLDACPNLRLICVQATGYNVVDCEAAKARNVLVCNVPAYGTPAVAQFTFSLLLELCNQVGHHSTLVHNGQWQAKGSFCFWDTPQMELAGKTMGIVGFGRIGRAVGTIAKAFGMNVLAYNRSKCPEGEAIGTYVELDELLRESDIISLHCPLTGQTDGMINASTIALMRDGVFLINTARGPLLDEQAVAEALKSGKIRGAAIDVMMQEPPCNENPLLHAPNCIITPHMAWTPVEARQRIIDYTAKNIQAFLSGHPINVVNK